MRKPITFWFLAVIFSFWMLGSLGPAGAIENLVERSTERDCSSSNAGGPARGPNCLGGTPSSGTSSTTTSSVYVTTTTSSTSLTTTTTLQPSKDDDNSKETSQSDKDKCLNSDTSAVGNGLNCSDATSTANFPATGTSSTSSTTTIALQPKGSQNAAESNSHSDETKCPNFHQAGLAKAPNCPDSNSTELVSATDTTTSTTSTSTTTTTSVPPPAGSGENELSAAPEASDPSAESTTTTLAPPTTPTTTVAPFVELEAGTSKIEVNGRSIESNQIQVGNEVTIEGGNVIARLAGAEGIQLVSENSGIALEPGKSAQLSLQGFQPDSEVRVVIYSEPRQLGILPVDSLGGFLASIKIPTDLEPGSHTLVLSGFNKVGAPIELKFGVLVNQNGATLVPVWMWPTLAFCLLVFAGFVIRTRKERVVNH